MNPIYYFENAIKFKLSDAQKTLDYIGKMCNIPPKQMEEALEAIKQYAQIVMHFHPDRLDENFIPVSKSLLESGFYKNQFETKMSNGKLAPIEDGPRAKWEQSLFGEAPVNLKDRPKYGALDIFRPIDGPCPRFGSCYFILKSEVSSRATFTFGDSYRNPEVKGTINVFEPIFASLLSESFERDKVLGNEHVVPSKLVAFYMNEIKKSYQFSSPFPTRNLDFYIEAQVHGTISLQDDIEYVVVDSSFMNTEIGFDLVALSKRYRIQLIWNPSFKLEVESVPNNFRGNTMPSLAKRVSQNGIINAYLIGKAAEDLKRNPKKWLDRGDYEYCLQEIKMLWHVLVKFGDFS